MERQLRLGLAQAPTTAVALPAEGQQRLIVLMAEAIVAVLEEDVGGEDDERSDVQSQA